MIGFGENLGSGFPLILSAWNEKHWLKPELIEQRELMQVKLKDYMSGDFILDITDMLLRLILNLPDKQFVWPHFILGAHILNNPIAMFIVFVSEFRH